MTAPRKPFDSSPVSVEEHHARVAEQMSEDALQFKIIKLADALGWRVYHTHDSRKSRRGYPDLHLVHAAGRRQLFRELKRQKGYVVSAEQKAWLADLTAIGADAGLWFPMDLLNGTVLRQLTIERRSW